jgi:serine/threonine-protein kinase
MNSHQPSRDDLLDRLAEEFSLRWRKGERPTPAEYAERYPHLADEICCLFPTLTGVEDVAATMPLSQVGDYRLLRVLGRGGMGVVYEAEQVSLGRRVAVKLLTRQAVGDPRAELRFQREARAAARLHHTNIVPVFEVGCEGGVFFYAMQLITGEGLDRILHELRRLSRQGLPSAESTAPLESRAGELALSLLSGGFVLESALAPAPNGDEPPSMPSPRLGPVVLPGPVDLFAVTENRRHYWRSVAHIGEQAASALAHAHSRGVIHRDVKPSNLLLDTQGVVWVTDFGLAKTEDEAVTHPGDVVGTPRYIAPERFVGRAGPAADIYALGLTLYELLTLRPAFDTRDRHELIEQIKNQEPPRPRSLQPDIPGDLETVVLKAMNKDPQRRYLSAQDLADDLRRWRAGEPVKARPVGRLGRSWRWARRNPAVAGLLALVLLVLALGSVASSLFALEARRQASDARHKAAAEAQARRRTREALDELSSQLIEDWLTRRGPLEPAQRAFLDKALEHYEGFAAESGNSEEVRKGVADACLRVGKIRQKLGHNAKAEAAYRRAQEVSTALHADFPTQPQYRQQLGHSLVRLGMVLLATGHLPEAEAAHNDAIAVLKPLAADFPAAPEYRAELGRAYYRLGLLSSRLGRPKQTQAAYLDALAVQKALAAEFPADPRHRFEAALTNYQLGTLLHDTGSVREAESAYRETLALYKPLTGDLHAEPQYRFAQANCCNSLAVLLKDTSRPKEAEAAFHDALDIQKRLSADFPAVPDYRQWLARSHTNLGALLVQMDRLKEAEAAYHEALALQKALAAAFPEVHQFRFELAATHNNLAGMLQKAGRVREAQAAYRETLAIKERLVAEFPAVFDYRPSLARTLTNLAEHSRSLEDYATARRLLEQAWPHLQEALKVNPRHSASRLVSCTNRQLLSVTLLDLGEHAGAAQTAAELLRVACDPAADAYKAACVFSRCAPLAERDTKLAEARRQELARSYGEQALAALRQALANGYKDSAHLQKDKDLDPLRQRDDFQKLLREVEAVRPKGGAGS